MPKKFANIFGAVNRTESNGFVIETFSDCSEVHIFSAYSGRRVEVADTADLAQLHALIGRILSQEQAAAANGKGADHA